MDEDPDVARLAAIIGEPARARMLLAMLRTQVLTAGELAAEAHVTPQTASGHLKLMLDLGMLAVSQQGRHRHYRLGNSAITGLLGQLVTVSESLGLRCRRTGPSDKNLRRARTCYDHMAGEIAVRLLERMRRGGLINQDGMHLRLSDTGRAAFAGLGIPVEAIQARGRPVCLGCSDWSGDRLHLAGRAGAALLKHFLMEGWLKRQGRILEVSDFGEHALNSLFAGPSAAA